LLRKEPQLHVERLVQVELAAQLLHLAGRNTARLPHHDIHRVARRQAHEEKDHDATPSIMGMVVRIRSRILTGSHRSLPLARDFDGGDT
jgi:hypothetical protein